ncbi:hypothetical protein CI807_19630 [Pseudomonas sp. NS1(2017)]|nr:hypothetical protein CI807_19630 [Pseudomonas sp. NS1(2017)]
MPHNTEIRYTIQAHDYFSATKIFNELARSKNIGVKQESDIFHLDYFGGGVGMYDTLHFSFKPNNPDGTFTRLTDENQ